MSQPQKYKLKRLYDAIIPLLQNLKKSSETTPDEQRAQRLAIDSLGDRIWVTTDLYLFIAFSGVFGFGLGLLIGIIAAYGR